LSASGQIPLQQHDEPLRSPALITASATFGHLQCNREPKSAPTLHFSSILTLIE
jgi:hypothetical protein